MGKRNRKIALLLSAALIATNTMQISVFAQEENAGSEVLPSGTETEENTEKQPEIEQPDVSEGENTGTEQTESEKTAEDNAEESSRTPEEETVTEDEDDALMGVLDGEVSIDEKHFPDLKFRTYIERNYDKNKSKTLSETELANITDMHVNNQGIQSLEGIAYFTSLKSLYCSSNGISRLNVSENKSLELLECTGTKMTELILDNPALTSLNCQNNQLASLDVSQSPKLSALYFAGNEKLTKVETDSSIVPIDEAHFPDGTFRRTVKAHGGNSSRDDALTAGEISKIISLDINQSSVKSLKGIEYLRGLERVSCYGNQIESLDVSENKALKELICYGNDMKELKLNNPELNTLYCYSNQLTNLDVSQSPKLSALLFAGNEKLTEVKTDASSVPIDEAHFPDATFREYVKGNNGQNMILTAAKIAGITQINVSRKGNIKSLNGIEYFHALKTLDCDNNQIENLDVSANKALIRLVCNNNGMRKLTLNNPGLKNLDCRNNKLMFLDLRNSGDFERIEFSGNDENIQVLLADSVIPIDEEHFPDANFRTRIRTHKENVGSDDVLTAAEIAKMTTIDVHNCGIYSLKGIEYLSALEELDCQNNQLTRLDVSTNERLRTLKCSYNNLKELILNNENLKTLECRDNQLTELDVTKSTGLESFIYSNNKDPYIKIMEGYILLDEEHFPDAKFRNVIQSHSVQTQNHPDEMLTPKEIREFKAINCSGKKIESLAGIEYFTELETLNCSNNMLTKLDIAKNTGLKVLDCKKNSLKRLYLAGNRTLTKAECQNNAIEELILQNPELIYLNCENNKLHKLNLDSTGQLKEIYCKYNKLVRLTLPEKAQIVDCMGNELEELNMEDSTELTTLWCWDNRLKKLNYPDSLVLLSAMNNQLEGAFIVKESLTSFNVSKNKLTSLQILNRATQASFDGNMLDSVYMRYPIDHVGPVQTSIVARLDRNRQFHMKYPIIHAYPDEKILGGETFAPVRGDNTTGYYIQVGSGMKAFHYMYPIGRREDGSTVYMTVNAQVDDRPSMETTIKVKNKEDKMYAIPGDTVVVRHKIHNVAWLTERETGKLDFGNYWIDENTEKRLKISDVMVGDDPTSLRKYTGAYDDNIIPVDLPVDSDYYVQYEMKIPLDLDNYGEMSRLRYKVALKKENVEDFVSEDTYDIRNKPGLYSMAGGKRNDVYDVTYMADENPESIKTALWADIYTKSTKNSRSYAVEKENRNIPSLDMDYQYYEGQTPVNDITNVKKGKVYSVRINVREQDESELTNTFRRYIVLADDLGGDGSNYIAASHLPDIRETELNVLTKDAFILYVKEKSYAKAFEIDSQGDYHEIDAFGIEVDTEGWINSKQHAEKHGRERPYQISVGLKDASNAVCSVRQKVTRNIWSYDTDDRTEEGGASGYVVIPKSVKLELGSGTETGYIVGDGKVYFASYESDREFKVYAEKSFVMRNDSSGSSILIDLLTTDDGEYKIDNRSYRKVGNANDATKSDNPLTFHLKGSNNEAKKYKGTWIGSFEFVFESVD